MASGGVSTTIYSDGKNYTYYNPTTGVVSEGSGNAVKSFALGLVSDLIVEETIIWKAIGGCQPPVKPACIPPDPSCPVPIPDPTPIPTPIPSKFPEDWARTRAKVKEAWAIATKRGANVKVGIIDDGIDYTHPLLKGSIVAKKDFTESATGGFPVYSRLGHGTHVAGTVLAVVPSALLVIAKSLNDQGQGTTAQVIGGVEYAIFMQVKVINMSLGFSGYSAAMEAALQKARNAGIIIVAAAGNTGGPIMQPAALPFVIAVGATMNFTDMLTGFSSRQGPGQKLLDICAGGMSITSTCNMLGCPICGGAKETCQMSGTSMASPLVAGIFALLIGEGKFEIKGNAVNVNCRLGVVDAYKSTL